MTTAMVLPSATSTFGIRVVTTPTFPVHLVSGLSMVRRTSSPFPRQPSNSSEKSISSGDFAP